MAILPNYAANIIMPQKEKSYKGICAKREVNF